ncbi:ras GEF, partial [Backusella circina FSU 941]
DVLSETIVNSSNLVPAQTSDSSFHSYYTTDYVPNIPVPPLLTTYRRLQNRLNDLENFFEETKKQQQQLIQQQQSTDNQYHFYQQQLRILYMSAMTIPSILQFSPHLIAYQLTLIESSIFRGIPCEALLSHSTRTPHKKIVASTDFFNYITRFIEHTILLPQEAPCRAKSISRWIKIATKLLALNNYQSLKAIVSALGTPPVQRLKKTWECIPKKHMSRLELLSTLMSESNNYRRYREHMGLEKKTKQQQLQVQQHHVWTKPVVPFLGVFIHDVTYLQCAANGNTKDTRFQDILNHMEAFQRAPEYPQRPPPHYYANHGSNNGGNFNHSGSKKHIPNAITNALHLGSSAKNQSTINTAALMGDEHHEETELELEQQLIIQYLLIRPWVSEKTIDALSNLREPKPTTSPTSLATTTTVNGRFNGDESKKLLGFWPFRRSSDLNRSSINTPPEPSWSEDEEDEDEEDEEVTTMTLINNDRKRHYEKIIESQPIQYESIHHPDPTSTISLQIS